MAGVVVGVVGVGREGRSRRVGGVVGFEGGGGEVMFYAEGIEAPVWFDGSRGWVGGGSCCGG